MPHAPFVPLRILSAYSMLEGAIRVKELVSRTKELGMKAVAITDHGNMHGAIDFYKKAKDAGVQAILGCELPVGFAFPGDKPDKHGRHRGYHLPLLAASEEGYKNLIALVSHAWRDAPEGTHAQSTIERLAARRIGEQHEHLQSSTPKLLIFYGHQFRNRSSDSLTRVNSFGGIQYQRNKF